MLQFLLGLLELFHVFEHVQMSENAHDLRKTVDLTHVQKFERLHFKAKVRVYQGWCGDSKNTHTRCGPSFPSVSLDSIGQILE